MSLTKIGSIGVSTGIQFAGVTTVATLHVGSGVTLSSDGDIFATGISTFSEDIKVGSGVTIGPDGDAFFTGIATGNGSGLTALNASNISSGTVPTARLGSGTASSSTFLRGDSTFQTVNTDLVSDTSPQLGGNLDVNTKNIVFGDSASASDDRLTFGASTDLSIYHDASHSRIVDGGTGHLIIQTSELDLMNSGGTEDMLKATANGAVELYYDNSKKFETASYGVSTDGLLNFNGTGDKILIADSGKISFGGGGDFDIYHDGSNNYLSGEVDGKDIYLRSRRDLYLQCGDNSSGYARVIYADNNGNARLYNPADDDEKFRTQSDGVRVADGGRLYFHNGSENASSHIRNSEGTGESNFVFNTYDGSSSADRWEITKDGHFIPQVNNDMDIGASSYRVRNIYTADLHCSNKGSSNDVDGTWGDYTIQEGESDLFLINNRSGKKYKFNLTEVS